MWASCWSDLARLTLARQPAGNFDLLQLDAFSADTVPTHLLTVEAFRLYLRVLKPDGIILVHITNEDLSLQAPEIARRPVKDIGAVALTQVIRAARRRVRHRDITLPGDAGGGDALALANASQAIARWQQARARAVRSVNDDY